MRYCESSLSSRLRTFAKWLLSRVYSAMLVTSLSQSA